MKVCDYSANPSFLRSIGFKEGYVFFENGNYPIYLNILEIVHNVGG